MKNSIFQSIGLLFFLILSLFFGHGFAASRSSSAMSSFATEALLPPEILISGLGIPWGFVFISGEEILLTQKTGGLKLFNLSTKVAQELKGPEAVFSVGQGGLLDIVLHPQFKQNAYVYVTYARKIKNEYTTELARAKLVQNKLNEFEVLLTTQALSKNTIHFGSRLAFDESGNLFMTVGDRNDRHAAQDLKSHKGKILRLTDQGKPAAGNPFLQNSAALPEIWSYGHRNPQGLAMHPDTGDMWSQEHGPRGGDEVNLLKAGANYGWPVITYGREYYGPKIGEGTSKPGMEQPLHKWVPSIAPSGMLFYSGKLQPKFKNHLFIGALAGQHLNHSRWQGLSLQEERRLFTDLKLRIRSVGEGPDGFIYFSTDDGKLLRFKP